MPSWALAMASADSRASNQSISVAMVVPRSTSHVTPYRRAYEKSVNALSRPSPGHLGVVVMGALVGTQGADRGWLFTGFLQRENTGAPHEKHGRSMTAR